MLAIRMQRTGRRGHAQFRVIVQDSRFSPKSGRVVAYLGSYNPHTKTAALNSEKTASYLEQGAQPSDGVARLLKNEGIKLPNWVKLTEPKERKVRNPEKLRRNQPAKEASVQTEMEPTTEAPAETQEAPAEEPIAEAEEKPAEEIVAQPEAETMEAEDPAEDKDQTAKA